MINKRQYDRYAVELDVSWDWDGKRVTAKSRDISLGGMFIVTDEALPFGAKSVLEVKLPAMAEPAQFEVTVRWSQGTGMGVQFGSLRARETWAINQLTKSV